MNSNDRSVDVLEIDLIENVEGTLAIYSDFSVANVYVSLRLIFKLKYDHGDIPLESGYLGIISFFINLRP